MGSKRSFSSIISYASHPIIIPLLGILFILQFHWVSSTKYNAEFQRKFILIMAMTTIVIPIFALGSLLQKYRPSDFVNLSRKERSYAAWTLSAFYFLLLWFLPILFRDQMLRTFFIAMGVSTLGLGIVNLKEKVSYHTFGWTGFIVMLVFLNKQSFSDLFFIVLAFIIGLGFIAYARLKQKAHTPKQVYLAMLLSLIINTIIYSYGF